MRIIVLVLLLGYLLGSCKSQKTDIKNGRSAYERKLYHIAAGLLQKQYDKEKNPLRKQETAFLVGRSFDRNNQPENAAYWYLKASKEYGNYTAEALFRYAQMLKKQELYDSAINAFIQA
ncbi:MAG: hypothetical protein NZ522_07100 [Chitinophagales bacterium]|nr:hypothetical protein [Chitinophagales bacterium]